MDKIEAARHYAYAADTDAEHCEGFCPFDRAWYMGEAADAWVAVGALMIAAGRMRGAHTAYLRAVHWQTAR